MSRSGSLSLENKIKKTLIGSDTTDPGDAMIIRLATIYQVKRHFGSTLLTKILSQTSPLLELAFGKGEVPGGQKTTPTDVV